MATETENTAGEQLDGSTVPILTQNQLEILRHTERCAAGKMFCGSSADMDALLSAGFMRYVGSVSWCPDKYYTITPAGREAMLQAEGR